MCAHCAQPAVYQCLKDEHYSCSQHFLQFHLRHKFQSITQEQSRRRALYRVFQTDISTLSQGSGLDRHFSQKNQEKADAVIADFRETFEAWVAVHRRQLESMRAAAEQCERSEMMNTLVGRLQKHYAKPLLKFEVEMKNREEGGER